MAHHPPVLRILTIAFLVLALQPVVISLQMIATVAPPTPEVFQLPPGYNKNKSPAGPGNVVHVEFEIHVQAINPIKASDMDFRMELTLLFRWTDPRLVFSDRHFDDIGRFVIPNHGIDEIWHPDPFFANAKSTDVGQLTQKLINGYIYQNQTVTYTVNLFATIACAMQFQYYPYDFQLCPTVIESFSYDENLVKYHWSPYHAFTINPKLRLLQFVVTYPLRTEECTIRRISESRNFSQLVAYFRFDRLLGNHLIQTFAPCTLIVSLSWFSFWLELDAVSARVSLLVTAMLTLVTQFSGLKVDFPAVAYAKAVDLWMAMCLCFVFAALGEFVVVKVIYSLTEDAKAMAALTNANGNIAQPEPSPPSTSKAPASTVPSALLPLNPNGLHSFLNGMDDMDVKGNEQSEAVTTTTVINVARKGLSSAPRKSITLTHRISEINIPDLRYTIHGRLGLPLVWTDCRTGRKHILWRDIDYLCKWLFPCVFCIGLSIYWTILFIHSRRNSPDQKPPSYCT